MRIAGQARSELNIQIIVSRWPRNGANEYYTNFKREDKVKLYRLKGMFNYTTLLGPARDARCAYEI